MPTLNGPSRDDLFGALIAAVEAVGTKHAEAEADDLRSKFENDEEPDFRAIAGRLGVPLEWLIGMFSKELYETTGDLALPTGTQH